MSGPETPAVLPAPWDGLKRFTDARIALGRAGHSQPTVAHLAFQLAHAQARDAVQLSLDVPALTHELQSLGLEVMHLHSAAPDRRSYLQRPDWGRRLSGASVDALASRAAADQSKAATFDIAFVVADGLSALGVMRTAPELLSHCLNLLRGDPQMAWRIAPVVLVEQGRVAIGDPIGQALRARMVVVLIGERPGLSSPDSLGIYFTWAPRVGTTDAERNCISNVRPAGLSPERAARTLHALLTRSRTLGLSGVALKDEREDGLPLLTTGNKFEPSA